MESPLGMVRPRKFEAQHLIGVSPPQSGRSSPRALHLCNSRDYLNQMSQSNLQDSSMNNIYGQHPSYIANNLENSSMTDSYDEANAMRVLKLQQLSVPLVENASNTYASTVPPDVLPRYGISQIKIYLKIN
jgi:hypothetical protein